MLLNKHNIAMASLLGKTNSVDVLLCNTSCIYNKYQRRYFITITTSIH